MPIFPFGTGHWDLCTVFPLNCLRPRTGMFVPRPKHSPSDREAVLLVFSKVSDDPRTQEYLGIFLAASTTSRVGLRCQILENVRPAESIKEHFEREISTYLKHTARVGSNIELLDKYEKQGRIDKDLAIKYGLNPLLHQVVTED
jgi:hypothetical protein